MNKLTEAGITLFVGLLLAVLATPTWGLFIGWWFGTLSAIATGRAALLALDYFDPQD